MASKKCRHLLTGIHTERQPVGKEQGVHNGCVVEVHGEVDPGAIKATHTGHELRA
jgi:hypothetical protein